MQWIAAAFEWAKSHEAIAWWIVPTSIVLLLLTPIAVGWIVLQLPSDYFNRKNHRPLQSWTSNPLLRTLLLVAKNLLGLVVLIAGIAMLVLPGQGLLTIVVGLVLMDFPGKFRVERWLATRRPVWRSLNWLRRRAHRPELQWPELPLEC
jgi:putative transmembrane protein PGPGW